jgi:hypothetical protein
MATPTATTDTRCETWSIEGGRCAETAVYLVVRAAIPATTYFPESPAVETLQCGYHAARWTRCDRRGRPAHPGMTAELI